MTAATKQTLEVIFRLDSARGEEIRIGLLVEGGSVTLSGVGSEAGGVRGGVGGSNPPHETTHPCRAEASGRSPDPRQVAGPAGSERCGAAGAPGRRERELGRAAGPFPRPHKPRGCGLPSPTDLTGTCSERI